MCCILSHKQYIHICHTHMNVYIYYICTYILGYILNMQDGFILYFDIQLLKISCLLFLYEKNK